MRISLRGKNPKTNKYKKISSFTTGSLEVLKDFIGKELEANKTIKECSLLVNGTVEEIQEILAKL